MKALPKNGLFFLPRSEEQCTTEITAIEQAGYHALPLPFVRIARTEKLALPKWKDTDRWVLTSKRAIPFLKEILQHQQDAPREAICLSQRIADQAKTIGLLPSVFPRTRTSSDLAEEIIQAQMKNRVVWFGNKDADETFFSKLRIAGQPIVRIDGYQNVGPSTKTKQRLASSLPAVRAAAFTAPSNLDAFFDVAQDRYDGLVGVIGDTTKSAAESRSISVDTVAGRPSTLKLVQQLLRLLAAASA